MTNERQNQQEKKKEYTIEVSQAPFVSTIESHLTTSTNLCKIIGKLLKGVAGVEFNGCRIVPVQFNRFDLLAYFTPVNNVRKEDRIVIDVISNRNKSESGAFETLNRISTFNSEARKYELSDKAKQLFEDLMYTDNKGKVNWKTEVTEVKEDRTPHGMGTIRQTVCRLQVRFDLYKLLAKIYGDKTNKGNNCQYNIILRNELAVPQISSYNSLTGMVQNSAVMRNWIISIERLDLKEINKKGAELGFLPSANTTEISSIPWVTPE